LEGEAMLSQIRGSASECRERTMRRNEAGDLGRYGRHEAAQQCAAQDANEAVERANATERAGLRCECGDPTCLAPVEMTHDEYEAVRAYGSRFLIEPNHENPESSWVLSENARFAVIDVVAGDARSHVQARNPRHAWTDAPNMSPG
jgi:hypothetical protein